MVRPKRYWVYRIVHFAVRIVLKFLIKLDTSGVKPLPRTGAVTASIDSSDGLACSLHKISRASCVGFEINNLPIAKEAVEFAEMEELDPVELALYGGEEYELVITVNPTLLKKLGKVPLIKIGRVTKEKAIILNSGKEALQIEEKMTTF